MRVIMVEPQGQGGICHYAYCLCSALHENQDADVTLVTARPYELVDAPRQSRVTTAFGPGMGRKAVQWLLRRPDLRQEAQPILLPTPSSVAHTEAPDKPDKPDKTDKTVPYRATSFPGRASRWLADREADDGWRRVLHLIGRKHPAVTHIQWLAHPERDLRWVELFHARHVPMVLTAHNVLPHDAPPESRKTWTRIYEAVDEIIVHYQGARDELASLGIDLRKVSVIPHGNYTVIEALTRHNGDLVSRRNAARLRLGLSPTAPVALCFGLMRPYKGIQYLLAAFASVRQTLPDAKLILAGRAPDGFTAVQAEISRLGLGEATLSLPTYLPLQGAADVFDACDVVALPYVEASQSGVVQLAYAYSRPVVATHVGGIPEAVDDGQTGVLVAPRDSDQLAQALITLLRDRENCALLGSQARRVAVERFAWEPIAEQTARIYARANKGQPPRSGAVSRGHSLVSGSQ